MSVECEKVDGVNLSQGVCDLTIPEPVRTAAKHAIDHGPNSYSRHDGTGQLRRAIAENYRRRFGLDVDPETEVVVSAGATGALYCACLALLEPGDEVIVFEPYYSYHRSTLVATDAVPVFVKTRAPTWDIDFDAFEAAIKSNAHEIGFNAWAAINAITQVATHDMGDTVTAKKWSDAAIESVLAEIGQTWQTVEEAAV